MDRFNFSKFLLALFVGIVLTPCCLLAQPNVINKLTAGDSKNGVRIIVLSPKPLSFRKLILHNKPRLVLDFYNTKLKSRSVVTLSENRMVHDIRYAYKSDKNLRMVFDLKGELIRDLKIQKNKVGAGYQLLVDLKRPVKKYVPLKKTVKPSSKNVWQSYFKAKPARDIVIVIDPGHGGKDPGASGSRGLHEKDIVLKISQKLQQRVNQQPGFKAVLTRSDDRYLPLRSRITQARKHHADMFIAIHADAYMNNDANGASVYALSLRGATSEAAHWLASKENASELVGGVDLADKSGLLKSVLLNLSQTATLRASLKIGSQVIKSLGNMTNLHRHKVEQAAFIVLKAPDIPSILVETGFISNPVEEAKLARPSYQNYLAGAITTGIKNYFKEWPPRGTVLAQRKALPY